jgi:hypothetical protein
LSIDFSAARKMRPANGEQLGRSDAEARHSRGSADQGRKSHAKYNSFSVEILPL